MVQTPFSLENSETAMLIVPLSYLRPRNNTSNSVTVMRQSLFIRREAKQD